MHDDITDVPGILVGHDTNLEAGTGCTVVVSEWPAMGGVDVRGGGPATHETDLLDPRNTVAEVHAVLLAGGSAYGLDAASGVMRALEARGVGYDMQVARVPIVPAAALFDLGIGSANVRPDAAAGQRATEAASAGPIARGTVGAGTGATVGKLGGPALAMKGGLGSASATLAGGAVVGALVAVNALGDVYDPATGAILAGARHPTGAGWLVEVGPPLAYPFGTDAAAPAPGGNTSIAVVATSLPLSKAEVGKVAQMAHDGLARVIRPAHTPFDGDTVFALSLAPAEARAEAPAGVEPLLLAQVGALAAHVLARAVADAVRSAIGLHGVPALRDLGRGA
jgi:L-aminopeptidase/D-esterase-like protein